MWHTCWIILKGSKADWGRSCTDHKSSRWWSRNNRPWAVLSATPGSLWTLSSAPAHLSSSSHQTRQVGDRLWGIADAERFQLRCLWWIEWKNCHSSVDQKANETPWKWTNRKERCKGCCIEVHLIQAGCEICWGLSHGRRSIQVRKCCRWLSRWNNTTGLITLLYRWEYYRCTMLSCIHRLNSVIVLYIYNCNWTFIKHRSMY